MKTFALHILPGPELPRFLLDPGFDLSLAVSLRPLADAGDAVEPWALDELYRITAGAELQPLEGALRAVTGSISVAATKAGASVTVAQGQCLLPDVVTTGEHPVIGQLTAGACP